MSGKSKKEAAKSVRETTVITCPRSMVGRVIGREGTTIKALQNYTNAAIQIEQSADPCVVRITGDPEGVQMASSIILDIVSGSFRGFALLRQFVAARPNDLTPLGVPYAQEVAPCVYKPGTGLVPLAQAYSVGMEATPVQTLMMRPDGTMYQQVQYATYQGQPMLPASHLQPADPSGLADQLAGFSLAQPQPAAQPAGNLGYTYYEYAPAPAGPTQYGGGFTYQDPSQLSAGQPMMGAGLPQDALQAVQQQQQQQAAMAYTPVMPGSQLQMLQQQNPAAQQQQQLQMLAQPSVLLGSQLQAQPSPARLGGPSLMMMPPRPAPSSHMQHSQQLGPPLMLASSSAMAFHPSQQQQEWPQSGQLLQPKQQ